MSLRKQMILRMVGIYFIIMGFAFFPSIIVAIINNENDSIFAFLIVAIPCLIAGLLIIKIFRPSLSKLKVRDGFLVVSLGWVLCSIIGAFPFVISQSIPSFVDAFFETASGFSTTGASILNDIESLSKSMLFWRSFTHWLGGMGIIVLLMALLPSLGIGGQNIAISETPGPTLDKLTPRFADTAKNLYLVYILITVAETILLYLGGLSLYDSLIHTFGTVGTGGFSSYGASVGHFTSPYVQWVITIFMVICGINFNLYFILFKNGPKRVFKDSEFRLYIGVLVIATVLITLNLYFTNTYETVEESMRLSAFQSASITTTTGYATANFDLWPTFSKMILFLLMLTGASSSSTGGGTKMIRILVALKMIKRNVSLKIHPNRIAPITINGNVLPSDIVTNISNFILTYIFVILGGTLIVALDGYDMITSLTATIACIGNIGPGFNLVGPAMNFDFFSDFTKFVLSIMMIAGRLEVFTFLVLFSPKYWNPNKA